MKKNEILDIALKILNDEGVENLSMRKIAAEVGCAPSTLYHHFKDKNELLNDVVLYADEMLSNYFKFNQNLEDFIKLSFTYDKERMMYHMFIGMHHNANFLTKETKAKLESRFIERKKYWAKFRESGELSEDLDKKAVHFVLMGITRMLANEEEIDASTRKEISQIVYRGLTGYNFGFENESRREVRSRMRKSKHHRRSMVRSCHKRKSSTVIRKGDNERNIR